VLYHLLTGAAPFRADSTPETLLLVLLSEPTPPRALRPGVPRDLETVCLKCLEKDPARRYALAEAVADDLDRWLRGKPITARPAGRLERAGKWARRNPGWASATAVSLLALAVFAVGSVVAAVLFKGERDAARVNETRAVEAEQETRRMLFDALRSVPGEVRGMRLRGERGAYFVGMPKLRDTLAKARELGAPPDVAHAIRNEMMNLLTAPDVTVDREWEWEALADSAGLEYDPLSDRYTCIATGRSRVTAAATGGEAVGTISGASATFRRGGGRALSFAADTEPDRRITCWAMDGPQPRVLWQRSGVYYAAFTADGRWAVGNGKQDGVHGVVALDAETGQTRQWFLSYTICPWLHLHPTHPWAALQRPGRPILVVDYLSGENVGEVRRDGRLSRGMSDYVCWHPTRPVLAAANASFRIHLVDVTTDRDVMPPLEGSTTAGIAMRFDRTGDRLVSWDWSGMLRVWDLTTGHQTFRTQVAAILGTWFDPGGDVLVSHTASRTRLQVLRVRLGEGLRVAADRPGPDRSRFEAALYTSPDGRLLVARQRKGAVEEMTRLGDPVTGAELAGLPGRTIPVGFVRPSGALVTHHANRGFERWPVSAAAGGRVRIGPPSGSSVRAAKGCRPG
jgi:hypothetical protein